MIAEHEGRVVGIEVKTGGRVPQMGAVASQPFKRPAPL